MNRAQYQLSRRQDKRARRRAAAGLPPVDVIPMGWRNARSDGVPLQSYRRDQLSASCRRGRAAQPGDAAAAAQARRDRARQVAANLVATHGYQLIVEDVPMHARLQVDVIKGQKIGWPRFENSQEIMALGAYRPLDDALRIAYTELIGWIHAETTLSELDAYQLLSQVGKVHVTEMVDPNYVVIASVDKRYLPPRKNGKPW